MSDSSQDLQVDDGSPGPGAAGDHPPQPVAGNPSNISPGKTDEIKVTIRFCWVCGVV